MFLLPALLYIFIAGCVDVPSTGPASPDYRANVRFAHFATGVDTIALLAANNDFAIPTVTITYVAGVDTITLQIDTQFVIQDYRRVRVDFGGTLEVLVDGGSRGVLGFGQASQYFDTPSGSRAVKVRATVDYVDSVAARDTLVTIKSDSIGPTGRRKSVTVVNHINTYFAPYSGTVTTVIDSAQSLTSAGTMKVGTMYLIRSNAASQIDSAKSRNNVLRFGRIAYLLSVERNSFDAATRGDTSRIEFIHGSQNLNTTRVDVKRPGLVLADYSGLAFATGTPYRNYRSASGGTAFTFMYNLASSSKVLDSTSVTVLPGTNYSLILADSANARVWKLLTNG